MTNEEKSALFETVDGLLKIFNENQPITNEGFNLDLVRETYSQMMQYVMEPEEVSAVLLWMDTKDFWKTPASTRFHGNFESGLAVHTLQVIVQSLKFAKVFLTDYFSAKHGNDYTFTAKDIFVAALAHDFCKSGTYEIQFRNTKDFTGNWVKKPYYKTRDDVRNLGHGNESVLILVEILPSYIKNRNVLEAVSRHMGFSDLSESESYNYSNFLSNPLVLLLQLADQTASGWYDN